MNVSLLRVSLDQLMWLFPSGENLVQRRLSGGIPLRALYDGFNENVGVDLRYILALSLHVTYVKRSAFAN